MQRARSDRVHKLTPEMPAPAKPVILTNMKNKIQLNAMLVEGRSTPTTTRMQHRSILSRLLVSATYRGR
ncbi:hypothetical protein NP493_1205g00020 [Ridgeia piscesae]|uniref:Uncharacterized protein n=1 Tax=Ridgeia piscesae TaxID=27915 RepID=A0AAD9KC83_RIDPI|nr:hypothetical protein NP493_1205g00020 [Ridgeia piscesae]